MSLTPNVIGPKAFYFNPGISTFTTAEVAAIDTAYGMSLIQPYAYTATVAVNTDGRNFVLDDGGSDLAAGQQVAWGLFLSPENDKGNLMFQFSGKALFTATGSGVNLRGAFFFGRRATSNTVVSSKAAPSNDLAAYTLLPSTGGNLATTYINDSIMSEGVSLNLSGGFVYCFGYVLQNPHSAGNTVKGGVSLAYRKWTAPLSVWTERG